MRHPSGLRLLLTVLSTALALGLAACSTIEEGSKIDYRSATKAPNLEVPPDLTQLARDTRYALPGAGSVSANAQQAGVANTDTPIAAAAMGDVRIERAGNQRWLVVARQPERLWSPLKDFWKENGFVLILDQQELGIKETDWAENRAKIPNDIIRSTIGKVFDGLYSTSERDRFRTRLERRADGATEIYISHRGLEEVYTSAMKDRTTWQPRAADSELEAEFLRRLMVKLGASADLAKALSSALPAKPAARAAEVGGIPVVQLDESFDRAWRRVGLSLDRSGFTVEDRDRAQGLYFVRYVPPLSERKSEGFFARLLPGSDKGVPPVKYRVVLRSEGQATFVSVLNAEGRPDASTAAKRIVQLLADDLK